MVEDTRYKVRTGDKPGLQDCRHPQAAQSACSWMQGSATSGRGKSDTWGRVMGVVDVSMGVPIGACPWGVAGAASANPP